MLGYKKTTQNMDPRLALLAVLGSLASLLGTLEVQLCKVPNVVILCALTPEFTVESDP